MRRILPAAAAVLGLLVAAAGTWAASHPLAFTSGWTAYSPLSEGQYLPVIGPPWWSLALIVVGAFAAGIAVALLLVGSRRRTS